MNILIIIIIIPILFYCFTKSKKETLEEYVNRKINEWKVTTYANNKFLFCIPYERIEKQREIFKKEYTYCE
jgi:hypothetical protein